MSARYPIFDTCKSFIFCFAFFVIGLSFPAQATYECGPVSKVFESLMEEGFALFSTAENAQSGTSIVHFIDRQNNWRLVGVDSDLNACVIMSGANWNFMIMRKI